MEKQNLFRKSNMTLILIFSVIFGLNAQNIEGDWYGLLEAQEVNLRVVLHINKIESGFQATFDSPDQEAFGIPVDTIKYKSPQFEFSILQGAARYEGMVNKSFTYINGTFFQNNQRFVINFQRNEIRAPEYSLTHIREIYTKKEVYITMRDGVKLFTSIYMPKDTSHTHPILIERTPYLAERREDSYNSFLTRQTEYVKEGYILVRQDVRGKYMSEGEFTDVRPYIPDKKSNNDVDESSDTYDTMDWLIKNVPHNNGNIGIHGISYGGFYATMALPGSHPALKAVSPQAPVTDWFIGDDFHHNGAFFVLDAFNFYYSFGRPRPEPTRSGNPRFIWPVEDSYEFFLRLGPVKNIKERYFGDTILFWNDAMNHPDYDDFWQARTPLPHLKNIKPAVLTVGGWFDAEDLYGPLHVYGAIEKQNPSTTSNRLIMGPWSHGQWSYSGKVENLGNIYFGTNTAEYFKEAEPKFFNYYLLGKGDMDLPEASIFITGANEWQKFDNWPPENITGKELYLQPAGGLTFEPPKTKNSFDEYVSDPMKPVPYTEDVHLRRTREYMTDDQRFAARRPDVMVYKTNVLDEDITFTGPLYANLFVSTTGTDADYVVKLIDVFPDKVEDYPENDKNVPMGGYQMLVRGEVMRGRFRNSFEKPEPFTPGKATEIRFELQDVAHTFKKGHRIMIQVQNSWFPLVDRNPQKFVDIYNCNEEDFRKATHRIYHDTKYPSHLKVKVLDE
jgi:putative CocE/NonD family hydrolase